MWMNTTTRYQQPLKAKTVANAPQQQKIHELNPMTSTSDHVKQDNSAQQIFRKTLYVIANVASLGILSLVEEKWNQESKAT